METFVVRLWTLAPAAGDPGAAPANVHGTALHVGTGRSATFRDGRELLELLEGLGAAGRHSAADRSQPPLDIDITPAGP